MMDMTAFQRALARLPEGAAEADVNAEIHCVSLVQAHEGVVTGAERSEQTVFFVRASGERTGHVYTQKLEEDPVSLLREALDNGRHSQRLGVDEMRRGLEAIRGAYGSREAVSDLGLLGRRAAELETGIRFSDPRIRDAFVSLRAETTGLRTLNSHGLDTGFLRPLSIVTVVFSADAAGGSFTGTWNRTAADPGDIGVEESSAAVAEMIGNRMERGPFKPGRYEAVLHRGVVYNIMSTAWQLFSGYRYMEGSCVTSGMLGRRIAAECLRITDLPARPGSGFDIPCDCEGSPGAAVDLVDRGVMTGLMHNLTTARTLRCRPTGNAGRRPLLSGSVATDIVATPRNFCIEPGASPLEELIGRVKDGLFITESSDVFHSINIASGDFSIPCRAIVVHDGKRRWSTGPLTLSGNTRELLAGIEEVGSDLYIGSMLALDNYGIGACSVRVRGLDFSGE